MLPFQRHACAHVPIPAGCPLNHSTDQPCHSPNRICNKALTLLARQTCPWPQKATVPNTRKAIFLMKHSDGKDDLITCSSWCPKGQVHIRSRCISRATKGQHKAKVPRLSTETNLPEWVLTLLFPAPVKPLVVPTWLMMWRKWNVAEQRENRLCSQFLSQLLHSLRNWVQVTEPPRPSNFLICKMGTVITIITHRLLGA